MSDVVFVTRLRKLAKSDLRAAIVEKHIAELDQRIASKLAQGLESDGSDRTERRRSANHLSLDMPIGGAADAPTQHDSIAAPADPAVAVEREQAITALSRVLSPKEEQIVELLRDDCTVDQVAETLGIARSTAHDGIKRIRSKVDRPDAPIEPQPRNPRLVFIDLRDEQLKPSRYVKAPLNLAGPRVERGTDDCPPCVLCKWYEGITTMPPPGIFVDPEILARKLAIATDPDRLCQS
jgi:DNA-binding CsgD family transcriptional regulator